VAPMGTTAAPLAGLRIGITADRKAGEQAELFRRRGAEVLHGPTMATVDLSGEQALRRATAALVEQPADHLVVTTGMGLRLWLEAAAGWDMEDVLRQSLACATITARGAKAASAARRAGLDVAWRAPGETMAEVVAHLHETAGGSRPRIALQLFDPGEHSSTAALRRLAGELVEVPVYRWRRPDDVRPARELVAATIAGDLAALTFTSQPAVRNLVSIADDEGVAGELLASLNDGVLAACVGPVCAEAAREVGITDPLWPDPPRLPAMVRQLTERLASGERREI
jgi:uroporphyrinogen-III synthase